MAKCNLSIMCKDSCKPYFSVDFMSISETKVYSKYFSFVNKIYAIIIKYLYPYKLYYNNPQTETTD